MATAIILAIAISPFILLGVALVLVGLEESKRLDEKADFILQTGYLPPPADECRCRCHKLRVKELQE